MRLAWSGNTDRTTGEDGSEALVRLSEQLARRGRVCLCLRGSSMLPWVRPGDFAILRKVSPGKVRCGDIVLFRRGARFFVHRLVERRTIDGQISLLTKGDANPFHDGVMASREVLARVERIYRGNRRIEFCSREKRALSYLIAQISRNNKFWFALVQVRKFAIGPAWRLLRALRPFTAIAR